MEDRALITIDRDRHFSLDEARQILPIVRRITLEYSSKVELLHVCLSNLHNDKSEAICALEKRIHELVHTWEKKIEKLGAKPSGQWVVDFRFTDGYYCWRFPETDIHFWHRADDGYSGRKLIKRND